jgi:outer membrane protein OmpA-like peptidoglycan-associated protein
MDAPLRHCRGLSGLLSLAGFAVLAVAISPASAQQVTAGKGSVTIDLGVLNQLGQPVTGGYAPYGQAGAYPQSVYGQPAYGQPMPTYGYPGQSYGGLLFPPQQYPVSTLTVQPPVGSVPYVPPASTASMAPAPASTGATASTTVTTPAATATTVATPPPPPTPAATSVPMTTTSTTTGTETTTGGATGTTTTAGTTTETTSPQPTTPAAPAVPAATPLASTDTGGTAATGTDTGSTTTTQPAPTPPAATQPAATAGTTDTTGTTGGTASGTTGAAGSTQTASIPPAAAVEGQIRIAFPADSAEIPDAVKAQLDGLAQKMASDDNMRIQLLAYASGTPETASRARRMSLSRALAVRSYLIKQGVRSTRMDVRALGNNVEGSPADRVDIIPKAQ